jgi:Oxidoreductase family, NAD-binding Rossmann fold
MVFFPAEIDDFLHVISDVHMNLSRRKIIRSLSMVAGATAVGLIPCKSLFANDRNETNKKEIDFKPSGTKALLIGAGQRGWRFGNFSKKFPDQLSIVSIAEPIADRRNKAAAALGLSAKDCCNHWEEVFTKRPEAEFAIIATSGNYMEACSHALLAGYHVLVDRPVSLEPDEVMAINKLAKEKNLTLRFCYIHNGQLNFMDHLLFETNTAEA